MTSLISIQLTCSCGCINYFILMSIKAEGEAIADLLKNEFPNAKAWIVFACKVN